MDGSQQPLSGFPSQVQEGLLDAARQMSNSQPDRGRGHYRRGRGQYHSYHQMNHHGPYGQQHYAPQRFENARFQQQANQPMANPTDLNSFPPLGTHRPQPSTPHQQKQPVYMQPQSSQPMRQATQPPNYPISNPSHSPQYQRREPPFRGRGGPFRGRGNPTSQNNHFQTSQYVQNQPNTSNEFQRPPPNQRKLYAPESQPHFNSIEDQRALQRKIMDQSDFLNHLASQSLKNQLTMEEQQVKESFRKELEMIAQRVVTDSRTETMKFDPSHVQLKLYGSLGSGFGVAGSDMDLLLAFPQNEGHLGDIEIESQRMLEKALLDAGIGARLLTNTRVPILRVCQKPGPELLHNLRECRLAWEQNLKDVEPPPPSVNEGFGPLPILTESQITAATSALMKLDLDACNVPLPGSPPPEHAKLEFIGDCGVQCDINFSNYVALHNTRLLKTYGKCDSRVRQVGVFMKLWAKARDINTPYRGTLSSYGYILMVLHYLMNVADPPVIPNLQEIAKYRDSFEEQVNIELVEGFDVRFVSDMTDVESIMKDMPRNHESVGSLLRGLFKYYADQRGFHWQQDVISIRSRSGRLTKRSKGWTEAKRAENNQTVRLRYLLAIEDPFELEHNVGRTVGHNGLVAIRDEFRRAWAIIDKIKFDNKDRAWYWLTQDNQHIDGLDLMSIIESRGDLLRKDQEFHKQKIRQMRQDLEAKEKALQIAAIQGAGSVEETELNGTFKSKIRNSAHESQTYLASASSALINNDDCQIKRRRQKTTIRRAIRDDEDESEDENGSQTIDVKDYNENTSLGANENSTPKPKIIDWSKPFGETEISMHPEWKVSNVDEHDVVQPGLEHHVSSEAEVQGGWSIAEVVKIKEFDWSKPFNETEISIHPDWKLTNIDDDEVDQGNFEHPLGLKAEARDDTNVAEAVKILDADWSKPFNDTETSAHPAGNVSSIDENEVKSEPRQSVVKQTVGSEAEVEETWNTTGAVKVKEIDWDRPFGETEISIHPDWKMSYVEEDMPYHEAVQPEQSSNLEFRQGWDQDNWHESGQPTDEEVQTFLPEAHNHRTDPAQSHKVPSVPPEEELDSVQVIIAWDHRTNGGQWLRRRDKQIIAGTWQEPTDPNLRTLDKEFPYDPNMTVRDLAVKNKLLRTSYMSSYFRKGQAASRHKVLNDVQSQPVETVNIVRTKENANPASSRVSSTTRTHKQVRINKARSEVSSESGVKQHSQRSRKSHSRSSYVSDVKSAGNTSNVLASSNRQTMPNRQPFGLAQSRKGNMTLDSTRSEHIGPAQRLKEDELTTTKESQTSTTTNSVRPNPPAPQAPQSETARNLLHLFTKQAPLVPLTLQPNVPAHHRSRDEDPNIMPIPRKPNFRFDPRQLADLEIIRRGGNGCARRGEEFDIEIDYEFGGGGAMAEKFSTGVEVESGNSKLGPTWEAKGDEEGLLDELPRDVDSL